MPYVKRVRRTRSCSEQPIKKKARSHVSPRPPLVDINGLGRLRTAHVLALTGISHSTLYARMKLDQFPKPDGMDGRMIYWNTQTIRAYLQSV